MKRLNTSIEWEFEYVYRLFSNPLRPSKYQNRLDNIIENIQIKIKQVWMAF